jgi:hypothetical protein
MRSYSRVSPFDDRILARMSLWMRDVLRFLAVPVKTLSRPLSINCRHNPVGPRHGILKIVAGTLRVPSSNHISGIIEICPAQALAGKTTKSIAIA